MLKHFLNYPSTIWNTSGEDNLQAILQNASQSCEVIVWSQQEFLPWDNPDNIVSAEFEAISRITRSFILVILFLIGGPGNVINMAVFYKQGLKDRVNLCLFALALADELYLIMAMLHHAEQVYLYFVPKEAYGPMIAFVVNNNLTGLIGATYVSLVLSAIIASERCLCVLYPLKFQALMNTKTMAVIIIIVYIVILGLYFIVALRYLVACMYVPLSGVVIKTILNGEFYQSHRQIIDYLDGFVFGVGLPTVAVVIVLTATIATVVKLRQIVTWRADTTTSLSSREVALTKMLVANSILFLICVFPSNCILRFSWLLLPEINSGRRHHNFYLSTIWFLESLTYFNSSLNIVVYYVMGSRYRDTCKSLFVKNRLPVKQ